MKKPVPVRPWTVALVILAGVAGVVAAAEHAPIDWAKAKEHWSFVPPKPQVAPPVTDTSWPKRRLDQFILARLEAAHLTPSREADPRTLIRRVTLDLTGLPP